LAATYLFDSIVIGGTRIDKRDTRAKSRVGTNHSTLSSGSSHDLNQSEIHSVPRIHKKTIPIEDHRDGFGLARWTGQAQGQMQ